MNFEIEFYTGANNLRGLHASKHTHTHSLSIHHDFLELSIQRFEGKLKINDGNTSPSL
jgi:hypothetical protein